MRKTPFLIILIFILTAGISQAADPDTAEILLLKEDYEGVIEHCTRLIESPVGYRGSLDKIFYLRALAYSKSQEVRLAREDLGKIISGFPKSKIKLEAKLALADTYFLEGAYPTAAAEYKNLIVSFPRENVASSVLFRLGQCSQRLGNWEEAKYYFQRIKLEWPNSPENKLVDELNVLEESFFCVQVGSFTGRKNAETLLEKLKQYYYPVYIVELKKAGQFFYRVRVGRFNIRKEAEELSERLRKEGFETRIWP